jgi:predicted MFS family arabinose efflux permease
MLPLGPQLMRVLSIGPQQFSYLLSAYSFSAAFMGIVGSFFVDRFDRKVVLLSLLTVFTVGLMICSMATDYTTLLLGRIIAGASGGNLGALILAVVAESIPKSRCGSATGFVLSAFSIASIVGLPIGLYIASETSWQVPYNILAIISLLILLIGLNFMPSIKAHILPKADTQSLVSIIKNKNLLRGLLFVSLLIFGGYTITSFLSPFLVGNLQLSEMELSYIYLIGGVATFVTSPITGRLIDKLGENKVFIVSAVAAILPLFLITIIPSLSKLLTFAVATLFFTLLNCRYISAMSIINSSVDACKRGSFMGLNSGVQQISLGVAAAISGNLINVEPTGQLINFGLVGVLAVVCSVLAILVSVKIKKV